MQFTIKTNELKALLLCAGKKDIRYYLNGVHFESSAHGMIAASTDGHRLLCINLPTENAPGIKALVPRELIESAIKTKSPVIDITIEGQQVTLSSAGQNVSGGLTDATFPDYRRVIPEKTTGENISDFNNEYLVDFDKVGKLVDGGLAQVVQNGPSAALVHYSNEYVIGVLMPMRKDAVKGPTLRPYWITQPAAPLQAAA
jgi:DNA polymerase-3 subunit beta